MSLSNLGGLGQPDESLKIAVWIKGQPIDGYSPAMWRRDAFGNAILYSDYGKRGSPHGWEIDHIHPKSLGGGEHISNLRPLHCTANATLGGILGSSSFFKR